MQDRNPSSMGTEHCWRSFKPGDWSRSINVRDFIVRNVTPYLGDQTFLAPSSNEPRRFGRSCSPIFKMSGRRASSRSTRKAL